MKFRSVIMNVIKRIAFMKTATLMVVIEDRNEMV